MKHSANTLLDGLRSTGALSVVAALLVPAILLASDGRPGSNGKGSGRVVGSLPVIVDIDLDLRFRPGTDPEATDSMVGLVGTPTALSHAILDAWSSGEGYINRESGFTILASDDEAFILLDRAALAHGALELLLDLPPEFVGGVRRSTALGSPAEYAITAELFNALLTGAASLPVDEGLIVHRFQPPIQHQPLGVIELSIELTPATVLVHFVP